MRLIQLEKILGSLKTIKADDITADVTYYHVGLIR